MKTLLKSVAVVLLAFASYSASADHIVKLKFIRVGAGGPNATGTAILFHDRDGDDKGIFSVSGLAPNTVFTLMMTQSPNPNTLPAYLVTEFRTDDYGKARFAVELEIFNAYIGVNLATQDANGVSNTPGIGDGAVANGAITISMDFFRIYNTNGNANVFGRSPNELAGAVVLASERIPDEPSGN